MIVIPAKYGSSRMPRKNFREFHNGLSLLQIATIRSVSANCGPVVISCENIDAVKEQIDQLPAEIRDSVVLRDRPETLSRDPATILDVLADCVTNMPVSPPDSVSAVLPTSPFNSASYIADAWKTFRQSSAPKLLSVSEAPKPPHNAWVDSDWGKPDELQHAFPDNPYRLMQSTACPKAYFSNGCISVYSIEVLLSDRVFASTLGYKMSAISGIDIDFEYEFDIARKMFPAWCEDLDQLDF